MIFNQTPDLASAYILSAEDIGMQNPKERDRGNVLPSIVEITTQRA
ncbi:hypothetical protein XBKB1_2720001 [Xenorhabdus bovienii str. kraussei Becker Underwood]|uniref:Uncharacterized protein n=1 Tax=Xenorhabdus bovienii str. kraussei Becker Underwood TaxID=1398204 RepID=A0A077PTL7_XENBV|nr:hypothetical protein XBKB1_2720001 [Xenorhabdus bovienii str. kraussei Becker Underwood]